MSPTHATAAHLDASATTKIVVGVGIVVSNVVGAGVVLALAGWVLPTRELTSQQQEALSRNVWLFAFYVVTAVGVGVVWGWLWIRVPPFPRDDAGADAWRGHLDQARQVVLRAPMRLIVVQGVPWLLAIVAFGSLNARYSWLLAAIVAAVITLGGLATVAVAYQLSGLALRAEVARVLAAHPPTGLRAPGVRARSLGSWLLGTGVPLLGVALVAATSLVLPNYYSIHRLGLAVLVLTLVALAVGFLLTALTSTSISHPVVDVSSALRRIEQGDLEVSVAVTDTTELGVLQAGFNTMVDGLRERDRVRTLFGRQVGEHVAEAAMEGEVELGGEVRDIAVLFVDLVGSTRMALEKPPHDVVALLNRFFSDVVDVVEAHQGWINKFEGDAALAVFGAPVALPDAAGCALAAARALAARLEASSLGVDVGIGVSAGPAVAGNIGDRRRYEYTVIGDPVNEASRLCDLAKTLPGRVAVSARALERTVEEADVWIAIGEHRLRGRDRDTQVLVMRATGPATEPDGDDPRRPHDARSRPQPGR